MDDSRDWLRLSLTPGLGPRTARALLSAFGLPQQILAASQAQLAAVIGQRLAAAVKQPPDPTALTRNLRWLEHPERYLLSLADSRYPQALLSIADPPIVLFAQGRLELLERPALAVVGSRHASAQGVATAESFAHCIADHGVTIVSGLAWGIDAAAHRGGLRGAGSTIAVMATGPDIVYPAGHRALAAHIRRDGLIVSEFSVGTPPLKGQFVRRNRLVAGLSQGVLVVEAALSSGSLTTARQAAEQGRDVFAIPGSIHSPTSRGCHALIREGAKLVDDASLVLDELRRPLAAQPISAQASIGLTRHSKPEHLPPRPDACAVRAVSENDATMRESLLAHIRFDPVTPDILCLTSGLTPDMVSAMLSLLEVEGRIRTVAGGAWQRTPD